MQLSLFQKSYSISSKYQTTITDAMESVPKKLLNFLKIPNHNHRCNGVCSKKVTQFPQNTKPQSQMQLSLFQKKLLNFLKIPNHNHKCNRVCSKNFAQFPQNIPFVPLPLPTADIILQTTIMNAIESVPKKVTQFPQNTKPQPQMQLSLFQKSYSISSKYQTTIINAIESVPKILLNFLKIYHLFLYHCPLLILSFKPQS